MGIEIERKFLPAGDGWRGQGQPTLMRQGYLCSDPERTVRVRIEGERAVITIKSKVTGASRGEWEYAIPVPDAAELLERLCEQPLVEKTRHRIAYGGHVWEVEAFDKPDWIGREVTGDKRYYNSSLIRSPYSQWKDKA
jgi:adenylate cyclase